MVFGRFIVAHPCYLHTYEMWTRSDHNIKTPVASVRLVVTPLLHLYEDGDGAYVELHLLLPFTRIKFNNP